MALQTGLSRFTGRLDNVIGYRRNGKYFFRSMPDKVRQTAATRSAARRFGMISRKGKLIRHALRPHLDMRYDGSLVNRLNKLLLQSGADQLSSLKGFHFNRHTGLEKLFTVPPLLMDDGTLHIPAQELLPQGRNTHVEVRLIAARINFSQHRIEHIDSSSGIIDISDDRNESFSGMALSVSVAGSGTLLVALQYRAYIECNGAVSFTGDRRYMAADIIRADVAAEPEIKDAPNNRLLKLSPRRSLRDRFASTSCLNATANGSPARIAGKTKASITSGLASVNSFSSSVIGSVNGSSPSLIARLRPPRGEPGRSNLPSLK